MDEQVAHKSDNAGGKGKRTVADRISIKAEHLRKLDAWVEQVTTKNRGVRLARNDVLAWLIETQNDVLSPPQETTIARMFYDEERFLRETLEQFRKCKGQGVAFDWYAELVKSKPKKSRKPRKNKGQKDERISERN